MGPTPGSIAKVHTRLQFQPDECSTAGVPPGGLAHRSDEFRPVHRHRRRAKYLRAQFRLDRRPYDQSKHRQEGPHSGPDELGPRDWDLAQRRQ